MPSSTMVANCVKAAEYVSPMITTACRWIGLAGRALHVMDKTKTVYTSAQALRANANAHTVDYVKVGASALLTGVEAVALVTDVRTNLMVKKANDCARKMNGDLSNLKQVGQELNQAATQASDVLAKTSPLAQKMLSEINAQSKELHITEDSATDMLNASIGLGRIGKKTVELQTMLSNQCLAGTENLMQAANTMNSTLSRLEETVNEYVKLSEQLSKARDIQAMCTVTEFCGSIVEESCQRDRFSNMSTNIDLTVKGVKAYTSYYPDTEASRIIKKHDLLSVGDCLSGTTLAIKKLSGNVPHPAPAPHAAPTNFYDLRAGLPENVIAAIENDVILARYICPLTFTLMRMPVILVADDGHSYMFEQEAILAHFKRREDLGLPLTNPSTNVVCQRQDISMDNTARRIIERRLELLRPHWDVQVM